MLGKVLVVILSIPQYDSAKQVLYFHFTNEKGEVRGINGFFLILYYIEV